jgi:hypothetical protein
MVRRPLCPAAGPTAWLYHSGSSRSLYVDSRLEKTVLAVAGYEADAVLQAFTVGRVIGGSCT